MAEEKTGVAGSFGIVALSPPGDDLRHTLNQYRIPMAIVTAGVFLSIVGFIVTLNWQIHLLQNRFVLYAAQEATLVDSRLRLFQEKMLGTLSLLEVLPQADARVLKKISGPMLPRVGISLLGWLPQGASGSAYYVTSPDFATPVALRDIIAQPPVRAALLRAANGYHPVVVSRPFPYPPRDGQQRYVLMVAARQVHQKVSGYLVGLVNINQIYGVISDAGVQPERATLYLFDELLPDRPFYAVGRAAPRWPDTPQAWQEIIRHTAFSYTQVLESGGG
ncbi:MAG: cache domain-containing protein, partial [Proteobacteria bacterium]|nr:cache domain-containing protein [Pseudomonadota bacterium]